jgi:hypothetical protein
MEGERTEDSRYQATASEDVTIVTGICVCVCVTMKYKVQLCTVSRSLINRVTDPKLVSDTPIT